MADRIPYIFKHIYLLHGLSGRVTGLDCAQPLLPLPDAQAMDPVCRSEDLRRRLLAAARPDGYTLVQDVLYFYYVFALPEASSRFGQAIIWGPFSEETHADYQKNLYLDSRGVTVRTMRIPLLDAGAVQGIIRFAHGLLTDTLEDSVPFYDSLVQEDLQAEIHREHVAYGLEQSQSQWQHHTLQQENEMIWGILSGSIAINAEEGMVQAEQARYADALQGMGKMAESPFKNAEYMAVCTITLMTRAVIAAGARELHAWLLSDSYLQQLEKARSTEEIYTVIKNFQVAARDLAGLAAQEQLPSAVTRQCRDYIDRHVYEKLSLKDIAAALNISPAYLSKLFSDEAGMTLTDYIMQEKVRVACELLSYSDLSIGAVAEYVSLSPQSYFTRVFKKHMQHTPGEYRRMNVHEKFQMHKNMITKAKIR